MSEDLSFPIANSPFVAMPRRSDRPWGHCLEVDLCKADGTVAASTSFACHPEFADFDRCQAMTTAELVSTIKERIGKDVADRCIEASAIGITLLGRINSPDEVWSAGNSATGSPFTA